MADLTPDQIGAILKSDLANLVKKVASGRTLSASERFMLEQLKEGKDPNEARFVTTQVELAKACGVSRKTIRRKLDAGGTPASAADGRYNVKEWRLFLGTDELVDEKGPPSKTQLQSDNILLQNEKLSHQIAILKKEWVPVAQVKQWGGELGTEIKKLIQQLHSIAPSIVGLPVAEAEMRLREYENELLGKLNLLDDRIESAQVPDESAIGGV